MFRRKGLSVFSVMAFFSDLVSPDFLWIVWGRRLLQFISRCLATLAIHPDTDADGQAAGHRLIVNTDD